MKTFYYQNKRPLKICFGSFKVLLVFILLFALFIFPARSDAQQFGSLVTYNSSISFAEDEGRMGSPYFVMVTPPENEIYIIDNKGRITIFKSDHFPFYTVSNYRVTSAQGMAADAEGNIYIAQAASKENSRPRISVFEGCLRWKFDIYFKGFEGAAKFSPRRMAIDKNGFIYVAGEAYPGLLVLDHEGSLVEIMVPDKLKKNAKINDITIDGKGDLYLLSELAGRVYVYNENREFLYMFGKKGGSSGKLSRPKAIAIDDRNGRKYIVDYMRHTVTVYDKEGGFIFEFGGMGWGEGWFQYPVDISISSDGRIFVADTFNNRVQVFDSW